MGGVFPLIYDPHDPHSSMTYWLDLFTGQTWQEFQDHGANVSGFRKRMHNAVERIKPGDILLCYLTGVMRWVGAIEVQGRSKDKSEIWEFDTFPERLGVKPLVLLTPEHGVPMQQLEGKVAFYRSAAAISPYCRFVQSAVVQPPVAFRPTRLQRIPAHEPEPVQTRRRRPANNAPVERRSSSSGEATG